MINDGFQMNTYGSRIAKLREKKGFTQKELAQQIEISRAALSHYEKSRRQPDYDTLIKIAGVLRTSTDYLLGLTNDPSPHDVDEPTEQDLEELMKKGGLMFDGIPMNEEDREDILAAMRIAWQMGYSMFKKYIGRFYYSSINNLKTILVVSIPLVVFQFLIAPFFSAETVKVLFIFIGIICTLLGTSLPFPKYGRFFRLIQTNKDEFIASKTLSSVFQIPIKTREEIVKEIKKDFVEQTLPIFCKRHSLGSKLSVKTHLFNEKDRTLSPLMPEINSYKPSLFQKFVVVFTALMVNLIKMAIGNKDLSNIKEIAKRDWVQIIWTNQEDLQTKLDQQPNQISDKSNLAK